MTTLDNPILNSPFGYPSRHWALDDAGKPTGAIKEERRRSEYIVPIATSKRKAGGQEELVFADIEGASATRANDTVNEIRASVDAWRNLSTIPTGVTHETARLIMHWRDKARERPLFFCQVEAAETIIWLAEVAAKSARYSRFLDIVKDRCEDANPGLLRLAMKLATGAGKTTVIAMLIAWHAINKARRPNSKVFSDAFLIVSPGITIRDRLRVLMPEAPDSIYDRLSIVPRDMIDDLKKARIVITNFHAFQKRTKTDIAKGTREVLRGREDQASFDERFLETDGEMLQRVMQPLLGRNGIIVINDEAHHCYEARSGGEEVVMRAEEETASEARAEAESNRKAARVWINGIRTVAKLIGVKVVYDLSATPFFLRGSGFREGELFGWVVSDFSLMDAIESGIVKVPRVPTHDDVVARQEPIFRHVYKHVREKLPKKGRAKQKDISPDELPPTLEAALKALYRDYDQRYQEWMSKGAETPPVFIVVANNTATSKLIYDWIAGWCENPDEEEIAKQKWKTGNLPLFRNVEGGKPIDRPRTILIDSEQLDSGEAISADFKKIAGAEIDAFKKELRQRDRSRDVDKIDDAELLREVMNTVGRKGRLGEQVRCVVSVSMLTEGWDANTVTHVLGCRAFGTQLLCEQVVGRALRRVSYEPDENGMFRPEYADVLGVPFTFMPANSAKDFTPPKPRTRVFADGTRPAPEIRFPRVDGYRVTFPKGRLSATFSEDSRYRIGADVPIPKETEVDPLIGLQNVLDLSELDAIRLQTVAYMLAKRALEKWARMSENQEGEPHFLFPQFLIIARRWLAECLELRDGRTVGYLSLAGYREEAVQRIVRACAKSLSMADREDIRPVMNAYNSDGSSKHIDFYTTKETLLTSNPEKCQVNYVVYDSDWEAAFAERLERIDRVRGYVKNHGLGFEVPYVFMGDERAYRPDFIVHWDDGNHDPLRMIVEIKGFRGPDAQAKKDTLASLWVPAVNNDGRFGRWGPPVEITEPVDMDKAFMNMVTAFETAAAAAQLISKAA
ncbi:BPTD_3080 family restriction endonuclease [Bradyrhizobium sp. SZCCHNS3052]|uniref:BPTD_3080 family restriction endonuclease n=1 Tax=Bradyrhizobium sp. SZCCHNS3052 TaxID=3057321 RepID=UPI002916D243|nr:DEAD/DEAH box helicase family protein [Bradyrhizobium sp. SZCCHNS3052]